MIARTILPVMPAHPAPRRRPSRRTLVALAALAALAVVVLNWTWGRLPGEPARTGSVVRVGGTTIRYVERPGRGTPVVLLHGLPGTAEDFAAVTRRLTGRRTIAIDRPGFGFSSEGYVPLERQADLVDRLLRRLGITRAVVVGHSYGGTLALALAERHRADVAGLVLVGAAGAGFRIGGVERAQAHLVGLLNAPALRTVTNATFAQALLRLAADSGDRDAFAPAAVDPAHRRRLRALNMTPSDLAAMTGEMRAMNAAIRRVDRGLAAIRRPAVVVQGAQDDLVQPRYGRRLAATLPEARLVLVHGGHMTPYTHPAVIAGAVAGVDHLARSPGRPVAPAGR